VFKNTPATIQMSATTYETSTTMSVSITGVVVIIEITKAASKAAPEIRLDTPLLPTCQLWAISSGVIIQFELGSSLKNCFVFPTIQPFMLLLLQSAVLFAK
jgi:hypothetical protein